MIAYVNLSANAWEEVITQLREAGFECCIPDHPERFAIHFSCVNELEFNTLVFVSRSPPSEDVAHRLRTLPSFATKKRRKGTLLPSQMRLRKQRK
jgi:hypothetical protein